AALQDVALAYLRRDGDAIPLWRMASVPVDVLRRRARAIAENIGGAAVVVDTEAVVGAGSAPGRALPSAGVAVPGDVAAALRAADVAVMGRVVANRPVLDLRSVDPADDELVVRALKTASAR